MKLKRVEVQNYRSIEKTTSFDVEADVTCLVGKNESGKTAILKALMHLNPTDGTVPSHEKDYPRKNYGPYRRVHPTSPAVFVTGEFQLSDEELALVESRFGSGALHGPSVRVSRNYANQLTWTFEVSETAYLAHLLAQHPELDPRARDAAAGITTITELGNSLRGLQDAGPSVANLLRDLSAVATTGLRDAIWSSCIEPHLPKFLYFGDYDVMAGTAIVENLSNASIVAKNPSMRTLLDLLALSGVTPAELTGPAGYESFRGLLEATANSITDEVFEFWSQNRDLSVKLDVRPAVAADAPLPAGKDILHVRIENARHRATVAFDERSKGFVWFFSFLARFNRLPKDGATILLLDEPGLSLHASAQADFLRFINERLSPSHQVVYSTHSPFMVEPARLNRVRTVEDTERDGTVVSADILRTERATSFPLQAALGYSMAQSLFVGPNNLLVEGASDLLYLQVFSAFCEQAKMTGLDPSWVIVPVGGADRLAVYANLLGANRMNVVALLDVAPREQQRVDRLIETRVLSRSHVITVAELLPEPPAAGADIEDLVGEDFLLKLVGSAYGLQLAAPELPTQGRLAKRIGLALKAKGIERFNHFMPPQAAMRLQHSEIPKDVLERFASAFARLNALMER